MVEKFEETEGPLSKLFQQEDLNNEGEEDEDDVGRRAKKTFARSRNPVVDDDDDDDNLVFVGSVDDFAGSTTAVDTDNHPNKKKRPNTPMAGGELSAKDDLDPPVKKSAGRKGAAVKK